MERRLPSLGPRGEGWFLAQLVFVVAVALTPPDVWPEPIRSLAAALGAICLVVGLLVAGRGVFDLGRNLTPFPRPRSEAELVEHGVYGLIRHPIYSGLGLIAFGWSLLRGSLIGLVLGLAFAVFLDLKARREEGFLVERFPGYDAYRRRTRRFIPGVY